MYQGFQRLKELKRGRNCQSQVGEAFEDDEEVESNLGQDYFDDTGEG